MWRFDKALTPTLASARAVKQIFSLACAFNSLTCPIIDSQHLLTMPRVSKTKASGDATPARATRSNVRAGSVELEPPVEAPTPRRTGLRSTSRSKTPESKPSSFEKPVDRLPALAEEEEKQPTPRVARSKPAKVAPIADAPRAVTEEEKQPSTRASRATRATRTTRTPRVALPKPADVAPIADASPYVTPQGYRHIASTYNNSVHSSPTVRQSIEEPIVIEDSVAIFQDDPIEVEQEEAVQAQIANEEAEEEEAVQAQFADETAHAGLSHSHQTPPSAKSLKRPGSSLVGRESAKRPQVQRVSSNKASPSIHSLDKSVLHSPLATISVNAVSSPISPFDYAKALYTPSPRVSRTLPSPSLSIMDQVLRSDAVFEELTDSQQTALLKEMRREIQRLREVETRYLATSKQSQSSTISSPQRSIRQSSSPEVPRTVGRQFDLRYHMSVRLPAEEARKAAEVAEAATNKAAQQEKLDQTLSRSSPSTTDDKRKSKTPQSKTPEAQTPQRSSQTSAPAETPAASPSWGLTSLFGSVKNIFSHRPILPPTKRLLEQPQEQPQEQQQEHPAHVSQQQQSTPARAKKQKRVPSSSQQSPTPKPRSPAPASPATPTPVSDEDPNYGQTPRTTRRPIRRLGSPLKRDTPSKPKEVNADRRAEQLEQAAQKTAERKRIQEQVDNFEQERRRIEEEQRKRDMEEVAAQKTGNKRRVKVDALAVIPSRVPGASTGTYGLVDGFFDYDSDSDEVEMEEDQIHLLPPVQEHPAKRQRLDENVFQPKAPAVQPPAISPVKQTAAPVAPPAVPATPTPNYSQLTQQAIEKQRLQFSQHKPKQPSRLRNVERLSTGSTIAASSPQQPLIAPLEDIQEVSPVPQLPMTPPQKVYNWPAGVSMETPETWARIDLLYTPEMRAADHKYFTNGLIAAMAKAA